MPKCPACDKETQKDWTFCPTCGMRLDSTEIISEGSLDKVRYLWERQEGGRFIYKNFSIIKDVGKAAYGKYTPHRPKLGDYAHINLTSLRNFSFLYMSPQSTIDFYAIGKLKGYYSAGEALRTLKLDKITGLMNKTGLFWKTFERKELIDAQKQGWKNTKAGVIDSIEIDKENKKLTYRIRELPQFQIKKSHKPSCYMDLATICGQAEALSGGGFWDGTETRCQTIGDPNCEIQLHYHEKEEDPKLDTPNREQLNTILDEIIDGIVQKTQYRNKLGDYEYASEHQCINYFMLSRSPGHAILSKHAGRICGERIAEKAQLKGEDAALAYLEDLFLYLKAGIIRSEKAGDRVIIRMKESVYASGVNNIHQNLCIFLAGIIEGALNKATGQKWDVSEMKCLASGFPECEFWCKKI